MSLPVQTLEYATARALDNPEARAAFRNAFYLSILSGLCVGVCFLVLADFPLGWAIHTVVFAVTLWVAVRCGVKLRSLHLSDPWVAPRTVLDSLAGAGLVIIGLVPTGRLAMEFAGASPGSGSAAIIGLAYLLLAATTIRHVFLYNYLAAVCRDANRPSLARGLVILGWFKAVYELIWLGMCAGALILLSLGTRPFEDVAISLAFGAFFATLGFGGVWIWMMICHGLLMGVGKPRR